LAAAFGGCVWRLRLAAAFGGCVRRLRLAAAFGGCVRRLRLAAVFGGCVWRLRLAAVFGGCVWRLRLAAAFGGCVWRRRLKSSGTRRQTDREDRFNHLASWRGRACLPPSPSRMKQQRVARACASAQRLTRAALRNVLGSALQLCCSCPMTGTPPQLIHLIAIHISSNSVPSRTLHASS
jgi:hypothetical protein